VSLSRRWTIPGRRTPPMPERLSPQWAMSALTSVPVLVYDVERDGLGARLGGDGLGQAHVDMLARLHLAARFGDGRPLDSDAAIGNKGLEAGPARFREPAREKAVEPLARLFGRHGRFKQLR
jgi:hypothetical protein